MSSSVWRQQCGEIAPSRATEPYDDDRQAREKAVAWSAVVAMMARDGAISPDTLTEYAERIESAAAEREV
ncbi:hypothetical protein [Arhodomonas aquaeolei]|uniref:hypothetical protein n=1 Tax=Arhodomonas aquaeolei TaxID=2369 RepID=UPI0003A931D1|nr:hypothetical protein [Arhodomonas aquaeolei]